MQRASNVPQPPPQPPPEPAGRPLATFERPGRGRDPDAELRVSLEEYQGNAYLSLRVWSKIGPGFLPTRKGVSVRLKEAEDVAAALLEGVRLAYRPPPRLPETQRFRPGSRPSARPEASQPPRPVPPPAAPGGFDRDFDEFTD